MDTKSWFSLAKVFYSIRKNKNSDFATFILNEKWNFILISRHNNVHDRKSEKSCTRNGVYSEPEAYTGHPIDERTEKIVIEYYINDDFNCSRQSANKSDVITVKINDNKEKKVKCFLTRSLKATYETLINDYPELRIGKSKFYSLRPKYVLLSLIKEVCFCIYCANHDLFLTSLINFRGSNVTDLDEIRSQIINETMCSEPSDLCCLQECKICPGSNRITIHVLKLQDIEGTEEITYALWDNGNLIKKTLSISAFIDDLWVWT